MTLNENKILNNDLLNVLQIKISQFSSLSLYLIDPSTSINKWNSNNGCGPISPITYSFIKLSTDFRIRLLHSYLLAKRHNHHEIYLRVEKQHFLCEHSKASALNLSPSASPQLHTYLHHTNSPTLHPNHNNNSNNNSNNNNNVNYNNNNNNNSNNNNHSNNDNNNNNSSFSLTLSPSSSSCNVPISCSNIIVPIVISNDGVILDFGKPNEWMNGIALMVSSGSGKIFNFFVHVHGPHQNQLNQNINTSPINNHNTLNYPLSSLISPSPGSGSGPGPFPLNNEKSSSPSKTGRSSSNTNGNIISNSSSLSNNNNNNSPSSVVPPSILSRRNSNHSTSILINNNINNSVSIHSYGVSIRKSSSNSVSPRSKVNGNNNSNNNSNSPFHSPPQSNIIYPTGSPAFLPRFSHNNSNNNSKLSSPKSGNSPNRGHYSPSPKLNYRPNQSLSSSESKQESTRRSNYNSNNMSPSSHPTSNTFSPALSSLPPPALKLSHSSPSSNSFNLLNVQRMGPPGLKNRPDDDSDSDQEDQTKRGNLQSFFNNQDPFTSNYNDMLQFNIQNNNNSSGSSESNGNSFDIPGPLLLKRLPTVVDKEYMSSYQHLMNNNSNNSNNNSNTQHASISSHRSSPVPTFRSITITNNRDSIIETLQSQNHNRNDDDHSKSNIFKDLASISSVLPGDSSLPSANPLLSISDSLFETSNNFISSLCFGVKGVRGPRPSMEDEHIIVENFEQMHVDAENSRNKADLTKEYVPVDISTIARMSFCAVYDGHGGIEAASYLKQNLASNIARYIHAGPSIHSIDLSDAISQGVVETDSQLIESFNPKFCHAGSVAVFALFVGRQLYIGNLGDCRAVLSRNGNAVPLSTDHRPGTFGESERITRLGGMVEYGCLNGTLAVSRAFGDIDPDTNAKMIGLSSEAEVSKYDLIDGDEFVILACDGVWDVVGSDGAVSIVRRSLQEHNDVQIAADELVASALRNNTEDNVTVIIVGFSKPSCACPCSQCMPNTSTSKASKLDNSDPIINQKVADCDDDDDDVDSTVKKDKNCVCTCNPHLDTVIVSANPNITNSSRKPRPVTRATSFINNASSNGNNNSNSNNPANNSNDSINKVNNIADPLSPLPNAQSSPFSAFPTPVSSTSINAKSSPLAAPVNVFTCSTTVTASSTSKPKYIPPHIRRKMEAEEQAKASQSSSLNSNTAAPTIAPVPSPSPLIPFSSPEQFSSPSQPELSSQTVTTITTVTTLSSISSNPSSYDNSSSPIPSTGSFHTNLVTSILHQSTTTNSLNSLAHNNNSNNTAARLSLLSIDDITSLNPTGIPLVPLIPLSVNSSYATSNSKI